MAGYIVTSGSNFTPFSYDELVKPVMQLTELHNNTAEEYDKLTMDTEALRNYIDGTKDKKTQELYDAYIKRLETLRDNLWERGYTAGTRRDLSAARAGYAGDISRIAKAVETRQNRSKEYWDTAHKNPDMIMGKDPGLESLDSYLGNDTFGQNWYSYSGNTFADEVATDIDARANAMLRDPEIIRNPNVAGYIQEKRQLGFTNDEINNAGTAAWDYLNGDSTQYDNLDPVTKIAADVLINRMNSTGATYGDNGNVSKDEYERLFQYGLRGAAKGIKAPTIKDFEDKNWEFQKQVALAGIKAAASASASTPSQGGYVVDPATVTRTSEDAERISRKVGKVYSPEAFRGGRVVNINMPDGTIRQVGSASEMTSLLYDTPERQFIKDNFGGIDIGLPAQNWLGTSDSRQEFTVERNGKTYTLNTGTLDRKDRKRLGITAENPVAIRAVINGENVLLDDFTKVFNENLASHQAYVDEVMRLNRKTLRSGKLDVSPKQERKLEKKYNLDSRLSAQDIPYVISAKNFNSNAPSAVLVDSSEPMSSVRQDYQNLLESSLRRSLQYSGDKAKSNPKSKEDYAFFPVKKGGEGFEDKGYTDISKIFSVDSNGNPKNGSLRSIEVYPSDLEKGMIRIQTDKGDFGVKVNMLGELTGRAMNSELFKNELAWYMRPFTEPDKVLLDQGNDTVTISDAYGNPFTTTYSAVIKDKNIQKMYYNSIIDYINSQFAFSRDNKGQNHFQVRGNTSTKPQQFNLLGQ